MLCKSASFLLGILLICELPSWTVGGGLRVAPPEDAEMSSIALPTESLKMMGSIKNRSQLDELFMLSSVDGSNSFTRAAEDMRAHNTTRMTVKGEGIPIWAFSQLGIAMKLFGPILRTLSRIAWSGKIFTFELGEDGELGAASLTNAILGIGELFDANVYVATLQETVEGRGEEMPHNNFMQSFGWPLFKAIPVDDQPSVMLDYELDKINPVQRVIDIIRPITREGLEAVGIEIPEEVTDDEISELWLGQATFDLGVLVPRRVFGIYFALHFDQEAAEFE